MLKATRGERRKGKRFPLSMDVEYRFFLRSERRVLCHGKSKTVDISHTGVLLKTQEACPEGVAAEMLLEWPAPSGNDVPMHLRVHGTVVRSDKRGTVVRIFRHGFQCGALQLGALTQLSRSHGRQADPAVAGG